MGPNITPLQLVLKQWPSVEDDVKIGWSAACSMVVLLLLDLVMATTSIVIIGVGEDRQTKRVTLCTSNDTYLCGADGFYGVMEEI